MREPVVFLPNTPEWTWRWNGNRTDNACQLEMLLIIERKVRNHKMF